MPVRAFGYTIVILTLLSCTAGSFANSQEPAEKVRLEAVTDANVVTRVDYRVAIRGKMITPANGGQTKLELKSDAHFDFRQRQFQPVVAGPFGVRAVRLFSDATSNTLVGDDYKTDINLPPSHRLLQVYGTESGLNHVSPDVRLTRQHVDLLQMPMDPLFANGLLPGRDLSSNDEKWNTDAWVVPSLCGMEAAISQSATCRIRTLTEAAATVEFELTADGAVHGSGSKVVVKGTLTFDRGSQLITALKAEFKELRSPGAVSPGLDVVANIEWNQSLAENKADLPMEISESEPDANRLLLTLATPWKLALLHNRNWHLFHETADMVMLRLLDNGNLMGQCNISPSILMPQGQFTSEKQFGDEVAGAVAPREGRVVSSVVRNSVGEWRIHSIRAESKAAEKTIQWDYHLCSHTSGQQFLVVFSHTSDVDAIFNEQAETLLKSLTLRITGNRSRIPLPR
ncbi:MAG: hypothetical protein R3C20_23530 [Planctomycetaceae bacterium]